MEQLQHISSLLQSIMAHSVQGRYWSGALVASALLAVCICGCRGHWVVCYWRCRHKCPGEKSPLPDCSDRSLLHTPMGCCNRGGAEDNTLSLVETCICCGAHAAWIPQGRGARPFGARARCEHAVHGEHDVLRGFHALCAVHGCERMAA